MSPFPATSGQRILLSKGGLSRRRGRSAQRRNLTAAKLVAEMSASEPGEEEEF